MTEYSDGRRRSCWNIASAMRSLMTRQSTLAAPRIFSRSLSVITCSRKRSRATSYPQSRKAPSVNFMMFPLCTSVTDSRPYLSACRIAISTSRFDPNSDIGLMPIAEFSRTFFPISSTMKRRTHALEVANRSDAGVEVEHLPQRDVQRPNSPSDGRRERTFDRDAKLLQRVYRLLGEPVSVVGERLLTSEDLHPRD